MILFLLGCSEEFGIPLHFEGPVAAAWLPESDDHPFKTPIGFVSNSRSGTIVPLNLKEGRLLSDDMSTSFLRASLLAMGRTRQLGDLSAFASEDRIQLWTLDVYRGELLSVPYITGVDKSDAPVEVEPTATDPTFFDEDNSGDSPTLKALKLRAGFTTTETWSIEFDGERWWAKGSLSGTQEREPTSGSTYVSDHGEVEFSLQGEATTGDRFEFSTDTGVQVYTLAGRPTALHGDGDLLYVSVESDTPLVGVMDPLSGEWLGSVALPTGAHPWRMAAGPDGSVLVGDARSAVFYVLRFATPGDVSGATVESVVTAAPVIDLAWQSGALADGSTFSRVFVAPVGLQRVDLYDLDAGAWVDVNPADSEVAGFQLGSPVSGLAASIGTVRMQQVTDWGAYPEVPAIVVSTQDGFTLMLDATTGCGVPTEIGPHGPNLASVSDGYTWAYLDDVGPTSDAVIAADAATGEQVTLSQCAGVARSESWSVTYDSAAVGWRVEGTLSGVQEGWAFDGQRYVSDNGAISFLVNAFSPPPTDGDSFSFYIDRGLLGWYFTDDNQDGGLTAGGEASWQAPARPMTFSYLAGPTGGKWDQVDVKEMAVLPVQNSDEASRLYLDSGKAEINWE
jgi:hypothetical protein